LLAKRIIPCLDVDEGRVVKGVNFVNLVDAGDPVEQAVKYDEMEADELVFLDITASSDKRHIMIDVVRRVAESVFIPFTVGGGIHGVDDIRELLNAGADKVSINTTAVYKPGIIDESSEIFGSQCIVVAIDAKWEDDHWRVYTHGGRTPTEHDAVEWAKALTRAIASVTSIPVIASGGAGELEHLYKAIDEGQAHAVLLASLFHYGVFTVRQAKEYLAERGVTVRL